MGRELRAWGGRPVDEWRRAWGVPALHIHATLGSTNDRARALAEAGAPDGTTVLADHQTRGRGRRGRVWESEPGQSLLLSMVTRPESLSAEAVLSLRLGLATARAIEAVTGLAVGLKWPNDLLVDGRKVGGMLCEGAVEGGRPAFVVAGTGVNVLQPDGAWTGPLGGQATSLAARTGGPVERPALAGRVIREWLETLESAEGELSADEIGDFARRDVLEGRPVAVDGEAAGTAAGIAPDGALRIVAAGGGTRRVVAGTVRPLEP